MRCDDVVRELAASTADRDRAAIAEHLAGCPACAAWARRAEGLDRLWEATRPAEPSSEVWDAVWTGIAQSLPCPAPGSARLAGPPAVGAAPSRNGNAPKILVHPAATPAPIPPRRR